MVILIGSVVFGSVVVGSIVVWSIVIESIVVGSVIGYIVIGPDSPSHHGDQTDQSDQTDQTNIPTGYNTRGVVRELSNMQNCQSPVSMSQSVSEWHTIISARDVGASENPMQKQKPSCGKSHSCPPSDTQTPIWIWSKNLANFICLPWMNNTKFHHMAEKHISGVKRDVFFGISCACLLKHSRNSTFINVFYLQSLPKRGHVSDCWRTTFSGPVSFQLRERVPSISPRLDLAGEQETYHKFKLQINLSLLALVTFFKVVFSLKPWHLEQNYVKNINKKQLNCLVHKRWYLHRRCWRWIVFYAKLVVSDITSIAPRWHVCPCREGWPRWCHLRLLRPWLQQCSFQTNPIFCGSDILGEGIVKVGDPRRRKNEPVGPGGGAEALLQHLRHQHDHWPQQVPAMLEL